MKKPKQNKTAKSLSEIFADGSKNSDQTFSNENTITDECGDTMWDVVLEQVKSNLPAKSNEEDRQPNDDQGKVK